jgi:hypothetical protein
MPFDRYLFLTEVSICDFSIEYSVLWGTFAALYYLSQIFDRLSFEEHSSAGISDYNEHSIVFMIYFS